MARYITVAFLCTRCLLVSNTPSFWDNFLPIPIETKKASEDVIRSGSEDLPVLDYQSPGSEYGLIHNVFGTNRRARKLSHSSWNKNDVWLEDGNLLVLKGGVLNGNTNIKDNSNIYTKRPRVKQKYRPSSRVIFKKVNERRSDRGFETRNFPLEAAQARAPSRLWLNLLGLNIHCFLCWCPSHYLDSWCTYHLITV